MLTRFLQLNKTKKAAILVALLILVVFGVGIFRGVIDKGNDNLGKIDGIEIEDEITIGAGGVVVRDILEKGTYVGVPVKKVR